VARRDKRPPLLPAIRALVRDAASKLEELSHIRAGRILVVSGEARRMSRATIRPLGGKRRAAAGARPRIEYRGKRMLYVITLRPIFFRGSTLETRVETLLHELFHISGRFDGTLHKKRRHAMLPGKRFAAVLGPLVRRYLAAADPAVLAPFGHDGEVLMLQWLEKPPIRVSPLRKGCRVYGDAQLFVGPVEMVTLIRR
jgi:predicted metallopeptidase